MLGFEEIVSFENLYKAHRRARLGKRHKKDVILFEANLSENLWVLHYDLKYGKYEVGGYHKFMIYDPKEREIQAITYRDRIVQHTLCDNYLMPILNRHLIYDNAACRKGKGTSFAIERLRKFLCEHYKQYGNNGYFVKIDVSKYFPSIDHDFLKGKLDRVIDDERARNLLYKIIDSYNLETGKGLPMGNQSSQCFALLYLNDFDKYYKETLRIRYYVRYMDDVIMLVSDKSTAKKCLNASEQLLNSANLNINKKSQIISVKNGINFIGWTFSYALTGKILQRVCKNTRRNIISRAKKNKKGVEKRLSSLKSYMGYLNQGLNYHFEKKVEKILKMKKGTNT